MSLRPDELTTIEQLEQLRGSQYEPLARLLRALISAPRRGDRPDRSSEHWLQAVLEQLGTEEDHDAEVNFGDEHLDNAARRVRTEDMQLLHLLLSLSSDGKIPGHVLMHGSNTNAAGLVLRLGAAGLALSNSPPELKKLAALTPAAGEIGNQLQRALKELAHKVPLEADAKTANEKLAELAETIGPEGKKLAEFARKADPPEKFWIQKGNTPHAVYALARALWIDVVAPKLAKPSALVYPVHKSVTELHSRTISPTERNGQLVLPLSYGQALLMVPSSTSGLDTFDERLQRNLHHGVRLLGSVTGHRVLRHEIFTGHEQAMRGDPDPRSLIIEGGWKELAERLELNPKKEADNVRDIVLAQMHLNVPLPDGSHGTLLTARHTPAKGQRRSRVEIVLGTALLPDYVQELRESMGDKSRASRLARRLVPVLPLPPFVGGRKDTYGPQATLSFAVVSFMRDKARQLADHGGVLMSLDDWATLAASSGVPRSLVPKVIERWCSDTDTGPALLQRTEGNATRGRYTLGDAHAHARAFLVQAGERELSGSHAGKVGSRARSRRLLRRGGRG